VKTFEVGGGSGFSRIEYMGGGAMLKPREHAKLGNSIGRSYDKAYTVLRRVCEQPENSSQRQ